MHDLRRPLPKDILEKLGHNEIAAIRIALFSSGKLFDPDRP